MSDSEAHKNPDDDFIYWELLLVYDVDDLNPLSREEIKERKLKKTKLKPDEYDEAIENWEKLFTGSMIIEHNVEF